MFDGKNFCSTSKKQFNNIFHLKIATGAEDDYTNDCLLDYNYFKDCHK